MTDCPANNGAKKGTAGSSMAAGEEGPLANNN